MKAHCRRLGGAVATVALLTTSAALSLAQSEPIPIDQLGAVATKQVEGNGLCIAATENGARLRCAFQRLEGEVTPEGLWLNSTTEAAMGERFRLLATAVGHAGMVGSSRCDDRTAQRAVPTTTLPAIGKVSITDQLVRFIRPGLTEEYSLSVDGVRQDFVIAQRPAGEGELRVELALSGARAEPAAYGARLTLDGSGRTLAYSRLRATDATGKELKAHIKVLPVAKVTRFRSSEQPRKQNRAMSQSLLKSAGTSAGLVVLVDDVEARYPIRIDPTFSDADWVSLNSLPGTEQPVRALLADGSGSLYIGGYFTAAGAVVANGIAKWDGSQWSALGSGMGGDDDIVRVEALALSGTDLYVGGHFTTADGVPANHIAKWDGNNWSALGSGMAGDYYLVVNALAVIGTNLYAGGRFTTAGGVAATNIAKWNGNAWSALGFGVDGAFPGYIASVNALVVSGNILYVGGNFTTAGGISANYVARWNGSSWSPLGSGMGALSTWAPQVSALAVIGTDLYAGGNFHTADGITVNCIAKWNGYSWTTLGSGTGGNTSDWVSALAVVGTDLYVGGEFTSPSGVSAPHVARWNGSKWSAVGTGMSGADWGEFGVSGLAVMGTDLYVGGGFTTVGGVRVNRIAKWDGTSWSALGSGTDFTVIALAVSGADLYVGGAFTAAGGVSANRIAKWNGSSWSALGSGTDAAVLALAASGADLYAGGLFTTAGGVSANKIAKWNGATWSALGSGLSGGWGPCRALTTIGTDLYAGGQFTTAGGVTANGIAKWNGSAWSALGSGMNDGTVNALTVIGSDLYAGGSFTTAGGVEANGIAKWNGTTWSSLGSESSGTVPLAVVQALTVNGTDLYSGGWLPDGHMAIVKWDGSAWSPLGSGFTGFRDNDKLSALAADESGHLFVGGRFVSAGNTASPFIIQANIAGLDFTWDAISSPQEVGAPFPVTLTARNASGEVLTNFTGAVNLSGYAPGLASNNVSVGTGTDSWGYPLYTRYHDARTQVICLTNELGRTCTLDSLALDIITLPGQTLENWTIRMKHIGLAEYPASPEWEGSDWTVVYQGDEPAGSAGWRTFQFSTPFAYDGTNNLLIDFSFNNDFYSFEGQCRSSSTSAYRSITYASDSKDGDPLSWSGTSPAPVRSQNVPNVVLGATFPDVLPVFISPTVTTPFVDGVWIGEVTVHEAVTNLVLRADDGLDHDGESDPFNVEAVSQPPLILTNDGQLGITNGCFGFNVQGQAGQVIVIEVSTNLLDWLPLQTNTLGSGPFYFSDPNTTNFTQRFYRAVTP